MSIDTPITADADNISSRQYWMSILARANFDTLQSLWQEVCKGLHLNPNYQPLRPAEIGMVMVRASVNGNGAPFNMGEATTTRCSVQMDSGEIGSAYILGRNKPHAELAAVIDGELQRGDWNQQITQQLLEPLANLEKGRQNKRQQKAAKTKVDFFTLLRGED